MVFFAMTPTVNVSVYIAASLDGFIARENGALDWLPAANPDTAPALEAEDHGYEAFMDSVDTVVLGRRTLEAVSGFDFWPYEGKRVVALSRDRARVPATRSPVEVLGGDPHTLLQHLAATGSRSLYVDGGATIQVFLAAGLVQRLILTTVPILLGRGIRLFGALPSDRPLRLVRSQAFPSGLVQSEYSALPSARPH